MNNDITLLPCPFCGCAMSLSAVARDWWRVTGGHDDDCILLGQRADAPQTDDQKQLLAEAWNRRAAVEADRQGRMPSDEEIDKLSHGFALQYQDHVRGFARALLSRYSSGQPAASAEPIYAFRRKGQDEFVTCGPERFAELQAKPHLFETRIFYAAPVVQEPAGYIHPDNQRRLEAGETAAFRREPYRHDGGGIPVFVGAAPDAARAAKGEA